MNTLSNISTQNNELLSTNVLEKKKISDFLNKNQTIYQLSDDK